MSERQKKILFFDNYPEAKMALGKVSFPAVIKPYESDDFKYHYTVTDYGEAAQMLYDAFEHSRSGRILIETY